LKLGALFALTACSSGGQVGDSCSTDAECGEMKCLRDKLAMTSSCVDEPGTGTCSPACNTHADCQKYGATLKCALSQTAVACNPTGICRDNYTITCTPGPCREAPAN
jgi:hypothetical protein